MTIIQPRNSHLAEKANCQSKTNPKNPLLWKTLSKEKFPTEGSSLKNQFSIKETSNISLGGKPSSSSHPQITHKLNYYVTHTPTQIDIGQYLFKTVKYRTVESKSSSSNTISRAKVSFIPHGDPSFWNEVVSARTQHLGNSVGEGRKIKLPLNIKFMPFSKSRIHPKTTPFKTSPSNNLKGRNPSFWAQSDGIQNADTIQIDLPSEMNKTKRINLIFTQSPCDSHQPKLNHNSRLTDDQNPQIQAKKKVCFNHHSPASLSGTKKKILKSAGKRNPNSFVKRILQTNTYFQEERFKNRNWEFRRITREEIQPSILSSFINQIKDEKIKSRTEKLKIVKKNTRESRNLKRILEG